MMCDKHVCKQIIESAQLLCAAHPKGVAPYKHTHVNHPCSIWTRESYHNYEWLCEHALGLCDEYTKRYKRVHKTQAVVEWCVKNVPVSFPKVGLTPFAIAIKDRTHHRASPVDSYRTYYMAEKKRFATWKEPSSPPDWWQP